MDPQTSIGAQSRSEEPWTVASLNLTQGRHRAQPQPRRDYKFWGAGHSAPFLYLTTFFHPSSHSFRSPHLHLLLAPSSLLSRPPSGKSHLSLFGHYRKRVLTRHSSAGHDESTQRCCLLVLEQVLEQEMQDYAVSIYSIASCTRSLNVPFRLPEEIIVDEIFQYLTVYDIMRLRRVSSTSFEYIHTVSDHAYS